MTEAAELRMALATGVGNAPLPARYEAAKAALAECVSVDECSTWAKKTAAIASYARQSQDKDLLRMAMRIRARAIRRCGELLHELPATAHRPEKGVSTVAHLSERDRAAREAGLSKRQKHAALRVAKVPAAEFERDVESDDPPTLAEFEERGTDKKPLVDIEGRDPDEYNQALLLRGALHDLAGMMVPPDVLVRGCVPRHYAQLTDDAARLSEWLTEVLATLERQR